MGVIFYKVVGIVLKRLLSNKKYLVLMSVLILVLSWMVFIRIFKTPAEFEITGEFVFEPWYDYDAGEWVVIPYGENEKDMVWVEISLSKHRYVFSPDVYIALISVDGGSPQRVSGWAADGRNMLYFTPDPEYIDGHFVRPEEQYWLDINIDIKNASTATLLIWKNGERHRHVEYTGAINVKKSN